MVRTTKCDVCRSRKVKCDLSKPCGPCMVKGRPCAYYSDLKGFSLDAADEDVASLHNDQAWTALSLVATKSKGTAAFQIWKVPRVKKDALLYFEPSRPLSDKCSRLTGQWARMIRHASARESPFGVFSSFLSYVPTRACHYPVVNLAMAYVVESFYAYQSRDGLDERKAMVAGGKALAELRKGFESQQRADSSALLVSMALHVVAEYLRRSELLHRLHAGALAKLIKDRWSAGCVSELDSVLVRAISGEEVQRALCDGEPSSFDDLPAIETTSGHRMIEAFPSTASDAILLLHSRLPRLISLEKRYRCDPDDASLQESLSKYALFLYDCRMEPLPVNVKERSLYPGDSHRSDCSIEPQFEFDTVFDYVLAVRYWLSRIAICATLQRLVGEGMVSHHEDDLAPESLEAEEIESAENIARCWHYALDPAWDPPLPSLRLSMALTVAYGTWHRLEKRCEEDEAISADVRRRATTMKELCLQISAHRTNLWNCRAEEQREAVLDCRASLCTVTIDDEVARQEFEASVTKSLRTRSV